ncbi:MAG: hypothetical protein ACRY3E_05020 [Candidatus Lariskella arthropodorum]
MGNLAQQFSQVVHDYQAYVIQNQPFDANRLLSGNGSISEKLLAIREKLTGVTDSEYELYSLNFPEVNTTYSLIGIEFNSTANKNQQGFFAIEVYKFLYSVVKNKEAQIEDLASYIKFCQNEYRNNDSQRDRAMQGAMYLYKKTYGDEISQDFEASKKLEDLDAYITKASLTDNSSNLLDVSESSINKSGIFVNETQDDLQVEISQIFHLKNKLQNDCEWLESEINHHQQTLNQFKTTVADEDASRLDLHEQYATLKTQFQQYQTGISKIKAEIESVDNQLESIKIDNTPETQDLLQVKQQVVEFNNQVDQAKFDFQVLINGSNSSNENQFDSLKKFLKNYNDTRVDKVYQKYDEKKRQTDLYEKIEETLANQQRDIDQFKYLLNIYKENLQEAESLCAQGKINSLKALIDSMENVLGANTFINKRNYEGLGSESLNEVLEELNNRQQEINHFNVSMIEFKEQFDYMMAEFEDQQNKEQWHKDKNTERLRESSVDSDEDFVIYLDKFNLNQTTPIKENNMKPFEDNNYNDDKQQQANYRMLKAALTTSAQSLLSQNSSIGDQSDDLYQYLFNEAYAIYKPYLGVSGEQPSQEKFKKKIKDSSAISKLQELIINKYKRDHIKKSYDDELINTAAHQVALEMMLNLVTDANVLNKVKEKYKELQNQKMQEIENEYEDKLRQVKDNVIDKKINENFDFLNDNYQNNDVEENNNVFHSLETPENNSDNLLVDKSTKEDLCKILNNVENAQLEFNNKRELEEKKNNELKATLQNQINQLEKEKNNDADKGYKLSDDNKQELSDAFYKSCIELANKVMQYNYSLTQQIARISPITKQPIPFYHNKEKVNGMYKDLQTLVDAKGKMISLKILNGDDLLLVYLDEMGEGITGYQKACEVKKPQLTDNSSKRVDNNVGADNHPISDYMELKKEEVTMFNHI